jgi:hypothetical protein
VANNFRCVSMYRDIFKPHQTSPLDARDRNTQRQYLIENLVHGDEERGAGREYKTLSLAGLMLRVDTP